MHRHAHAKGRPYSEGSVRVEKRRGEGKNSGSNDGAHTAEKQYKRRTWVAREEEIRQEGGEKGPTFQKD